MRKCNPEPTTARRPRRSVAVAEVDLAIAEALADRIAEAVPEMRLRKPSVQHVLELAIGEGLQAMGRRYGVTAPTAA